MQNEIKNILKGILNGIGINAENIPLEHPVDLKNGDYSTSVALAYAKEAGKNPREFAEQIHALLLEHFNKTKNNYISKIEIAGPGFINFYLTREFFTESIKNIDSQKEDFGKNNTLSGKRIMVEYTDPNPFKEFHIGHLMSNAVGESISRIIEAGGAKVIHACYQGDVGLHVAKALWAILQDKNNFPKESLPLRERINYISSCYVKGSAAYEENESAKEEIKQINKKVFEKSDNELNSFYELGRTWTLEHFEEIYKKLGTKFDYYFFESEMAPLGMQIVSEFLDKGVFEKSDNAIVYKGEKHGLHTRVFITSQGLPTYETKELGLNTTKFEKENLDQSIIITANEQNDYFKVVLEALKEINPNVGEKTKHISHGMLRFASGKMSSRKGNIITGESLLVDAEELIHEKMKDREFADSMKADIAEKIAVAALKYSILKQATGSDIVYDFETSLSFEGDSGPYLQYTYTRAVSIIEKGKNANIEKSFETIPEEITEVEKLLYRFPEIVLRAGSEYSPHYIATYLTEVARAFNTFYSSTKIIDGEDKNSAYKIALTEAVSIVLKNGLQLLGIEVTEKM